MHSSSAADFSALLFHDTWTEFQLPPEEKKDAPDALLLGVCAAAAIVSCLNYYWFSLMVKSLIKIFYHGQTWTLASDKTDKKVE